MRDPKGDQNERALKSIKNIMSCHNKKSLFSVVYSEDMSVFIIILSLVATQRI